MTTPNNDLTALAARMQEAQAGDRMMEMIPMPITLVVTDADKQAACDLIGKDTYGKPHWTVETIPECNRVVQAFARHRIASAALLAHAEDRK